MKGRSLAILVVGMLLLWAASPAWCEEGSQKITTHPIPPAEEQKAAETSDASAEQGAPVQERAEAQPAESAAPETAEKPADETMTPPSEPAEQTAPAAPEQTAEPQAAEEMQSDIQIEDAVVCQDVVDRTPVGVGDVFSKEIGKVYCFSRVVGMQGEGMITHNWYYKGALKASVKLPVRSTNWRTWSSKTMTPEWAGEWMVEILSEEGTPLQSIIFFIQ